MMKKPILEDFKVKGKNLKIIFFYENETECRSFEIGADAVLQFLVDKEEIISFDPHWVRFSVDHPTFDAGVIDGIDCHVQEQMKEDFLKYTLDMPYVQDFLNDLNEKRNKRNEDERVNACIESILENLATISVLMPEARSKVTTAFSSVRAIKRQNENCLLTQVFNAQALAYSQS